MNYIIASNQYPIIKKTLKKVLKERLGEPDDFNVINFDLNEDDERDIIDEFSSFPLGYDRKAVVIDNADFLSGGNKTISETFADALMDDDAIDVIFILRDQNLDMKNPVFKKVEETGRIIHFKDITKEEWPQYVRKQFKDNNVTID